jgi:hypothetical protein
MIRSPLPDGFMDAPLGRLSYEVRHATGQRISSIADRVAGDIPGFSW